MKKYISTFFIVILTLLLVGTVSADSPGPDGPYESSIWIQNIGTESASCTITFYDASGAVAYSTSSTIAVDDTWAVIVSSMSGLASGSYSLVVSSSQPVSTVSNFDGSNSVAGYTGISQDISSTEWYAPGLYDNYYSYYSNVYAQNVSSSSADITIEIFAPGNSTAVYTNTKSAVPAYASVVWEQEGLSELNDNIPYAAKISSAENIVAVANIYGSSDTLNQLYSYNAFPAGGMNWYTPVLLKEYYGWNASLIIQNISDSTANVTVNYNTGHSDVYSILPHSVESIFLPHISELPSGGSGLFSANIVSDQNVVVTVNQSNVYDDAATYNGSTGGSINISLPHLVKKLSDFNSSVTCQNLGSLSTTLTISYYGAGPVVTDNSTSISPGGTFIFYLPHNTSLPDGYEGSASVVSDNSQNISCIGNISVDVVPIDNVDTFSSYTGTQD